jgi:putative membrane protein
MIRLLIAAVVQLAANAVGLLVAANLLEGLRLDAASFVIAVTIFTVAVVVLQPLIRQIALKNASVLIGSTALVTTFVGLLITDLVSDGMSIEGVSTWILATIIVWVASLVAALLLPLLFVKRRAAERSDAR